MSHATSSSLTREPRVFLIALASRLAWLNVALHALALTLTLAFVRPAAPFVPLADRLAHLSTSATSFRLAWAVWMLCALALVAFFAAVSELLAGAWLARLALSLATAGAAVDLLCDLTQAVVLTELAAGGAAPQALFLAMERLASAGGIVVANGLYSLAVLALGHAAASATGSAMPRLLGLLTFLSGMALAGAGLGESELLLSTSTGATMLGYALWVLSVARALARSAQ